MSDGLPGFGNEVDKDTPVELAKLHMAVLNMAETLTELKTPIDDLYEKVITGNGQPPLLTRVTLAEKSLDSLADKQVKCQAPGKIYELQSKVRELQSTFSIEQKGIEDKLSHLVDELELLTDEDVFRRRKIWGLVMEGIKTVVIIGVCTLFGYFAGIEGAEDKEESGNTTNTSYNIEVIEDECMG